MSDDLARFGGSLGAKFRRDGHETLRVLEAEDRQHVVWRYGNAVVAHFAFRTSAGAETVWRHLEAQFGSAADRVRPVPPAIDLVLFDDSADYVKAARRGRRLAVVGSREQPTFLRFLAVIDAEVIGAAELTDLEQGRALAATMKSVWARDAAG